MFDSLKEKLGSFREDVEESAEEKAADEEAEADEAETVAEEDAETAADAQSDAAADAQSGDATASRSEAAQPEGTDTRSDAEANSDAGAAASPSDADSPSGGADVAGAVTDTVEEDDDDGPGFAKRAKSFATGQTVIEEEDLEAPLEELEMALLQSDVEFSVAQEIMTTLREELVGETHRFTKSTTGVVQRALKNALLEVISVGQFDFDERVAEADKPLTIVFTGVNGVGKTTSIAKLARYFEERGLSTVLANGDTYRAGANEQIEEHADALDKKIITHEQGGDPAAVIYDAVEYAEANDVDVVLGDTAGRLHTSDDLMEQLSKIDRVVEPDMTLFVDEAVAGQDAVQRAKQFNDAAEIDGAILTKADADAQGGAAISIAHVTGKPILFLGTGQGYDDIEQFEPEDLVDRLLGIDG
ncbi:signal recognition particle-docking protein FtsY [Natronoarchaeum philippinense]|uniref:Signal recognition particle receptor FtsY n=1 Tax=Natronoarchaeum philippinense TaxID=558529 RepID=A0A285NQJ3_NATPI|nr:signal recognition particle-docking protein FtsY [Natronoarchaeum philippinense]SNZ11784.1 signal recognition particle-docking protein FtsY [Natronoarchaeum philippinense]